MFKQRQSPKGIPSKKALFKCKTKLTGEHPRGRLIPAMLHMQLY